MKNAEDPMEKFMELQEQLGKKIEGMGKFLGRLTRIMLYNGIMLIFIIIWVFILLIILSPLLLASENAILRGTAVIIYAFSAVVKLCHQLPYRSFIINGIQQPVCSRDIGIYIGFITGTAIVLIKEKMPRTFNSIKIILIGTIPIAIDGITQTVFTLRESNNIVRLTTGFIFSFCVMAYLVNRFLISNRKFRSMVLKKQNIAVMLFATVMFYYLVFINLSIHAGADFISKNEAVLLVNETNAEVFYIAPNVRQSIRYDPFFGRYNDSILSDIYEMELPENDLVQLSGLWVVVSDGKKYYISPLTGEIIHTTPATRNPK